MNFIKSLEKFFSENVGEGRRFESDADLARHSGLSPSFICRFKKGKDDSSNIGKFCAALDKLGISICLDSNSESKDLQIQKLEDEKTALTEKMRLMNELLESRQETIRAMKESRSALSSNVITDKQKESFKFISRIETMANVAKEKFGKPVIDEVNLIKIAYWEGTGDEDKDVLWKLFSRIVVNYPEFCRQWMYWGEGEMLMVDKLDNGKIIQALKSISEARERVIEQENEIRQMVEKKENREQ